MERRRACANSALAIAVAVVVFAFFCASPAAAAPVLPDFSPSNFTPGAPIDNPYFPLVPGTTFRAAGNTVDPETGETVHEVDVDMVTRQTQVIGGVPARIVHAQSFEDGVLVEDTQDFYAQDKSGNVWYLGEATRAFERDDEGNIVSTSTAGSWRTGVNGGKPGYIMPGAALRQVGFEHYQEFAPADQAVDQAKIVSLNETVTVPAGHFTNVVKTQETSAVEPGVIEFKYYAPGVGLVLTEEDVDANGVAHTRIALESVTVTAIPLPPAQWMALVTAAIAFTPAAVRRYRPRASA